MGQTTVPQNREVSKAQFGVQMGFDEPAGQLGGIKFKGSPARRKSKKKLEENKAQAVSDLPP